MFLSYLDLIIQLYLLIYQVLRCLHIQKDCGSPSINLIHYCAGATLSRGLNRGLGTLVAGGLALAVAESSKNLGKIEAVILITSTFIVGKHWGHDVISS